MGRPGGHPDAIMAQMDVFRVARRRAARGAHSRCRSTRAFLAAACAWALVAGADFGRPATALAQSPGAPPVASPATPDGRQAPVAQAGPLSTEQTAPAHPIHLKAHAIAFVAGAATLTVVGALQSRLAPETCRWCDLHADGTDALNGLDRSARNALLWQHPDSASTVSDVMAYGVVPAVAFGFDGWAAHAAGRGGDFKIDALAIGEALVLAANVTEIVKYAAARQRPYAHARALGEEVGVSPSSSDNLSFTSAHTAVAFAMTVSAARVMTLRRYGHERWVWALGMPAAAAGCVAASHWRQTSARKPAPGGLVSSNSSSPRWP